MDYLYITENQYQELLKNWENGKASEIENDPRAYILVTDEGFIAIDNSENEFFTEEFGTEIEAKLYLGIDGFSKEELIEATKAKISAEYKNFERLSMTNSKEEIFNGASEIVTKMEVKGLLTNDDYLNSLDQSKLTSILNYTARPLNDVWNKFLKYSEFDLSYDSLDYLLDSIYANEPKLNEKLDFYLVKKRDQKEKAFER